MLRRILFLAILSAGVPAEVAAQSVPSEEGRPYYVERFSPSDYGQNEQNWSILQDGQGRIFVANRTAVLEFDGKDWRSHLIPNQFARSLALAPDGSVCVGGVGEIGCLRTDPLGGLEYESLLPMVPEAARRFGDVWTAHSLADGVYFQTFNRVLRWDGEEITVWEAESRFHKAFVVRDRYFVRDEGAGLLEIRAGELVTVHGGAQFADERIDAMLPSGGRDILIVTRNRGFLRWDGTRIESQDSEVAAAVAGGRIYHGTALSDTTFALGTISGRAIIGHIDGSVISSLGTNVGLQQDELVLDLFQDGQGGLWLALDTGIIRVDAATPLTFFDQAQGLDGIVYHMIRSQGELYVSTSQGLYRLEPAQGLESVARFVRVSRSGQQVWNTLSVDNMVLTATNEGVFEVLGDGSSRLILEDRALVLREHWSSYDIIYAGLKDGLGILRRQGAGWALDQVIGREEFGEVRSIYGQPDGSVWVGTLSGGIFRAWAEPDGTYRFEAVATEHGLPSATAILHSSHDHQLYALSPAGVYTLDQSSRHRFTRDDRFDEIIDFASARGYLVNAAEPGRLWVISDGEIGAYVEQDGRFVDITPPGLRLADLPARILFVDHDDVVWMAVEQGLLRYDPLREKDYTGTYHALIRSVAAKEGGLLYGGSGAGDFRPADVSYVQNRLRFEVAAATFNMRGATRYQFRLEGFDDGWSEWSRESFKEYTNLPEGRYQFHVRARNAHGVLSTVDTFAFTVLPPWYRTWWAFLFYGLGGALVIWGFSHWRLREHRHEMERDRRVRRELETANARLVEANERLHEADRLKDDLLANTSHELRTPLTAILGFASVLHDELSGDKRDFAEHIKRSGKRLLQTVDSLLDMARLQADTMDLESEEFDLTQLVRDISQDFKTAAQEKNLLLKVLPESMSLRVCTDRGALTTILTNLIGNAIKFTDEGGVTVLVDADEEQVYLTVRDTGIGITKEFLPQLFRPFKQASAGYGRAYEGTGVGLAIAHRLVQLLGGQIEVDTHPGAGSCFRVSLPRRSRGYRISGTQSGEVGRLDGRKLLLVTNPERPEHVLRSALRSLTDVTVAEGAGDAVTSLQSARYDVVLVDTQLRCIELRGVLTALRLESGGADAAFVAVTAEAAPGDRERYLQMGFDQHISRPFTRSRLLTALEALLNQELVD